MVIMLFLMLRKVVIVLISVLFRCVLLMFSGCVWCFLVWLRKL